MHSVMVVDDDRALRTVVKAWVESFGEYTAAEAVGADDALERLDAAPVDIALCGAGMPERDGVWLATQIRERHPRTAVIMASRLRDVDVAIASLRNDVVDYLLEPFDRTRLAEALLLARDWHLAGEGLEELQLAIQDRLRARRAAVAAALADAQDTHEDAIDGLIDILQLHERDGRGHATRVARRVMRTHPQVGYDLLQKLPRFAGAAEIVVAHHESYDGSGYPRGLKGEQIPIGARILAVADAYDSMTTPHTQRPPMPPAMALQEIERCRGTQFDPDIASALGDVLVHAVEERVA